MKKKTKYIFYALIYVFIIFVMAAYFYKNGISLI